MIAILLCAGLASARTHKWVKIDLSEQMLYCYDGDTVVYKTHFSTGRRGHRTPRGTFHVLVKKYKGRALEEYGGGVLYYCLKIRRHVLIHEYWSVPKYPHSHGCIRTPVGNGRRVYYFCRVGTTVVIQS